MRKTALQELQDRYTGTSIESGLPILPSFQFSRLLEKTLSPAINTPGELLELSLRLEFKAFEVSAQDLQQLVTPLLDASLPEGYTILPGTLSITTLAEPVLDDQEIAHWNLLAQRQLQAVITPEEAVQLARGLPIAEARQLLFDQLPLAGSPEIKTFPSWWPFTPFLPLRIEAEVVQ